jgi:chromate transporter
MVLDVFAAFLRLGCTSFGGPVAHLAYFRREFVERRAWLEEQTFAQCIALTQLLPGPASSQTGMLIGWLRAGAPGALAAWIGFTLPSAAIMAAIGISLSRTSIAAGWLHGPLLVATAVVASALVSMRASLAPDAQRIIIALAIMILVLATPQAYAAPAGIGLAALAGAAFLHRNSEVAIPTLDLRVSPAVAAAAMLSFIFAFVALGTWAAHGSPAGVLTDTLFRIGSLVFGGGHVVLPLLQSQAVSAHILDQRTVLTGYAAAQAMPGPLFSIASFVGATGYGGALGVRGALLATCAIFAPSFFLLAGVAPFYGALIQSARFRAALSGANAGVVGLLAAAFVTPIFNTAVRTPLDGVLALLAFLAIYLANVPAWALVILAAFFGVVLER